MFPRLVTFPVVYNLFGSPVHAHQVFELLGYATAAQAYWFLRRRNRETAPPIEATVLMLAAATFGAFLGAKGLAILESLPEYLSRRSNPMVWLHGKTIVGGLLGAWAGVEIAKRVLRVRARTGDLYVFPLILGIAVGRIGCFLEGLPDRTHGVATSLLWGVDFGDGIPRHPTQLYESIYLLCLAVGLIAVTRLHRLQPGGRFRLFMAAYLAFRVLVEFIKPTYKPYLGVSAIQLASTVGLFVCLWQLARGSRGEGLPVQSARRRAVSPPA